MRLGRCCSFGLVKELLCDKLAQRILKSLTLRYRPILQLQALGHQTEYAITGH